MNTMLQWIDQRSGLRAGIQRWADAPVPGRACGRRIWPCTILFTFCVQAITGFFLWMHYSPSTQTAWESVYHLQNNIAGGALLRAVHHYAAQVLLVLVGIYLLQTIVLGAYRKPRELVFWIILLMGMVTLGLLLTGDLLAWDRNSVTSTQTRVSFLNLLPLVGGGLYKLAAGGPEFGHLTLTRFFALHAGLFSASFLVLLILHGVLARRADAAKVESTGKSTPFWPNQALLDVAACVVVLGVILIMAVQCGTTLGSPGDLDPDSKYSAARPEWAFLGLYAFSHLFPGKFAIVPIFVIPGLLVCVFLAMPWIGRRKAGYVFNLVLTVGLLIGLTALSFQSIAHDKDVAAVDPKRAEAARTYVAAVAAERAQTARIVELIEANKGIPAAGALSLLQNDPRTQGPKLFAQHCANCHNYGAPGDKAILAKEVSAPELYGFASREWIAGLLHPERIKSDKYFGKTKFRKGEMAGFLAEIHADLDAEDEQFLKEDLANVVVALSAEAQFPWQQKQDAKDARQIEQGRELISDTLGCTDCHRFRDKKGSGSPDLTGYGSQQWIAGIIADPTDKRFYGKNNDRMPAYCPAASEAAQGPLTPRQVEMLSTWLRVQ
ncbi:MAG: cytochrome b N-terminal domain-containing protein [Candidatus Nealsonbacteria bacterium]|nr:cytochrome b N-terminal domain-containing protein [Candidatus Nealsonbacteria bacterium]